MDLQGDAGYQHLAFSRTETEAQRKHRLSHCFACKKELGSTKEHPSFKCPSCFTLYCSECLQMTFREALSYNGSWPPKCYYRDCSRQITTEDVSNFLPQALKAKIPERAAARPLFCANVRCTEEGNTFLMDVAQLERRVMVDCQVCGTWACSSCRRQGTDHIGDRFVCVESEEFTEIDKAHNEYEKTAEKSAQTREHEQSSMRARRGLNEIQAPDTFTKYHRCPKCGEGIQRSFGCDHMICQRCRQEFCWCCGKPVDPADGTCACRPDPALDICSVCRLDNTECRCDADQ